MNCPNCSAEMDQLALAGKYGPDIEVDLCFACHALWLDRRESLQLTPRGTLELFQVLHEHGEDARHVLGRRPPCPRCALPLELLNDIGKGGRFSYYRCPDAHGRLTPFSEFLKEKQFVRDLNPLERTRLAAEVKQVQCSSCGAPVDLHAGFACQHCGSPLTVLDTEAVSRTLTELTDAEAGKSEVSPEDAEKRARAVAAMESMRSAPDDPPWGRGLVRSSSGNLGVDLLTASIGLLFREW